jgi:hypothetical protein
MGITGAAIALLAGGLVALVAELVMTRSYLSAPLREWWPPRQMAATALAYVVAFGLARAFDTAVPGLPGLLTALFAGLVAYVACFALLGGLLPRDRERLASLARRLAPNSGFARAVGRKLQTSAAR